MSDEVKSEAPVQQPVVDVKAIEDRAAKVAQEAAMRVAEERAEEIANAKLKNFGRQLAGEGAPDPAKQYLEALVTNPIEAIRAVTQKELNSYREEQTRQNQILTDQQVVVGNFAQDYPDLLSKAKLASVEKLAADYERQGMSYRDALRASCEEVVKDLGLKSVKETQISQSYGGLPRGGANFGRTEVRNEEKLSNDFIASMRSKSRAVRHK